MKFKNPNFAAVAQAMGAHGIRIEEPGDVRDGIAEALAHKGGPVVVDVLVDPFALARPSHVPFHTVKGFTLSCHWYFCQLLIAVEAMHVAHVLTAAGAPWCHRYASTE